MANCPNCSFHLKPWHIRAECPSCGVNIPNFNWEERMEQDADIAEAAFKKFRKKIARFKSGLFGSKPRIMRFAFSLIPLVILVLPLFSFQFIIPFTPDDFKSYSILTLTIKLFSNFNLGGFFSLISYQVFKGTVIKLIISFGLIYAAIIVAVANFFLLVIGAFRLRYIRNVICCAISTIFFALSPVFLKLFATDIQNVLSEAFSLNLQIAYFAGIGIFLFNTVLHLIIGKGFKRQLEKEQMEDDKEDRKAMENDYVKSSESP